MLLWKNYCLFILSAWQASIQVIAPGVARLIKKFKHKSTYQQTSGVAEITTLLNFIHQPSLFFCIFTNIC